MKEVLSAKGVPFIIKEKRETISVMAKGNGRLICVLLPPYDLILRAVAANGTADQAAIERIIQDAK